MLLRCNQKPGTCSNKKNRRGKEHSLETNGKNPRHKKYKIVQKITELAKFDPSQGFTFDISTKFLQNHINFYKNQPQINFYSLQIDLNRLELLQRPNSDQM